MQGGARLFAHFNSKSAFFREGGAGEFRGGWVRLGGGGKVDNLGEVGWFGGSWMVLGGSW